MEISPLRQEEVEGFVDELWVPAQREMAALTEQTLTEDIRRKGLSYRRSLLPEEDSVTYLARDEDRLLGYLAAEVQTPPPILEQVRECHITELFVREAARRQGIARELLGRIESWARDNGCEQLDLKVRTENQPAVALYETLGYESKWYNMKKRVPDHP